MEKKILSDMSTALKNGDKVKLSILRMVASAMKNKKIEDMVKTLEDAKVIALIQKMAREHVESIEQFKKANRDELVKKEQEELRILKEYLPETLTGDEVEKIITASISETGASSIKDMGKVMTMVIGKVKGRADGKLISEKVKEMLVKKGDL